MSNLRQSAWTTYSAQTGVRSETTYTGGLRLYYAERRKQVTILSAIDVTTGLTMSCVVPTKGPIDYAVNELRRFALEAGRTSGKLQSDQESSIKALVNAAAAKFGMGVQMAPSYYKQSQGVVERWHRELWGHTRVLKATVESN